MRRAAGWALVAAAVVFALVVAAGPTGPTTISERADRIAAGLRCPVCQGLSVKDSDSPTARDLRADIRRRLEAGQSGSAIRAAYVARYGEWILLRPQSDGLGALVWLAPPLAAAAGAATLVVAMHRWRRRGRPASDEDRRLVEQARAAAGPA
ncbi:MAG: cytochrome c-type biogenesis protein [Actinomycetota bacterium]